MGKRRTRKINTKKRSKKKYNKTKRKVNKRSNKRYKRKMKGGMWIWRRWVGDSGECARITEQLSEQEARAEIEAQGTAAARLEGEGAAFRTDLRVPYIYKCPITEKLMADPVQASDGYTYEKAAFHKFILTNGVAKSPLTGEPLDSGDVRPNRAIKDLIEQWCEENGETFPDSGCNGSGPPIASSDEIIESSLMALEEERHSRMLMAGEFRPMSERPLRSLWEKWKRGRSFPDFESPDNININFDTINKGKKYIVKTQGPEHRRGGHAIYSENAEVEIIDIFMDSRSDNEVFKCIISLNVRCLDSPRDDEDDEGVGGWDKGIPKNIKLSYYINEGWWGHSGWRIELKDTFSGHEIIELV